MAEATPATKPDAGAPLRAKLGYVTEQEVCDLLAITILTGRNRQRLKRFPPVYNIGHERLCRAVEVEAWIRRHRVAA